MTGQINRFVFIRAAECTTAYVDARLIGCFSDNFRTNELMLGGVIFAAGSVEVGSRCRDSIIVSDGDVKFGGHVLASLIIARGTVICGADTGDCQMIAKRVKEGRRHWNCQITKGEGPALGFVKFFSPREQGIAVEEKAGEVQVTDIRPGKLFGKSGLRPGDKLLAVDGQAVDSVELFRRLLRRGLVTEEGVTLRFERDGKAREIWLESPW
jgi:hypothetical protein